LGQVWLETGQQDAILPHKAAEPQPNGDRRNRLSHQKIVAAREEIKFFYYNLPSTCAY
jgi:hypothetical protein